MTDDLSPRLQAALGSAFLIQRELGGGGMARVFLAQDAALERTVVVKVLDLQLGVSADAAERFRREVKVIARLQHPHIVPVITAGGAGSLLWYVMPYVAGESLRARLVREGALPLADALRIARELFGALGHAHAQGIVHRDVKPENILLESGHAVVADFGVAKALADAGLDAGLTSAGLALGTPAYMAPEQALADETTNHRADLYAGGAVLYEMLVGAPPFTGNAQSVIAAHITAPAPRADERRGDVPPAVANLVAQLLAKSPAERPQRAAEVIAILETANTPSATSRPPTPNMSAERALAPSATTTRATAATAATAPARRRGPLPAVLAVAAVVGVGALALWGGRAGGATVAPDADAIAVIPLGSTGDEALERFGRDLAVTLSANLDGVGTLRAVDAMTVLQRTRPLPQPLSVADARQLGTELGARSVLHGTVLRVGDDVRAEVALYPVGGGEPIARASVLGPERALMVLTDSLTTSVLQQVWQRGTPPSPLLREVTTASTEALRAFLEGEELFRSDQMPQARAAYARAIALDSNFVQAYLRLDFARSYSVLPVDVRIRQRLLALRDRLSWRDRDLLDLRLALPTLPFPAALDSGRILAARYPDYHQAQYDIADLIIHDGPAYGVPIRDAQPYLDRLDVLAPDHADNALHKEMVANAVGDTLAKMAAFREYIERVGGASRQTFDSLLSVMPMDSLIARKGPSMDDARQAAPQVADGMRINPDFRWRFWLTPFHEITRRNSELVALARTLPSFAGLGAALDFGDGLYTFMRGDMVRGVRLLEVVLGEAAPPEVQFVPARLAAYGTWLGTVPVAVADSALARTRRSVGELTSAEAAELAWMDAVIGIAAEDSMRVWRAMVLATDTSVMLRPVPRAIRALWRERRTGQVDSLRAVEDETMTRGRVFAASLPLNRLALGRGLVRAGDPVAAERYLQWSDAVVNTVRLRMIVFPMAVFNSYQRGLAAEAAGDRGRAIMYFERFVASVDQPASALEPAVADARARLARLVVEMR